MLAPGQTSRNSQAAIGRCVEEAKAQGNNSARLASTTAAAGEATFPVTAAGCSTKLVFYVGLQKSGTTSLHDYAAALGYEAVKLPTKVINEGVLRPPAQHGLDGGERGALGEEGASTCGLWSYDGWSRTPVHSSGTRLALKLSGGLERRGTPPPGDHAVPVPIRLLCRRRGRTDKNLCRFFGLPGIS